MEISTFNDHLHQLHLAWHKMKGRARWQCFKFALFKTTALNIKMLFINPIEWVWRVPTDVSDSEFRSKRTFFGTMATWGHNRFWSIWGEILKKHCLQYPYPFLHSRNFIVPIKMYWLSSELKFLNPPLNEFVDKDLSHILTVGIDEEISIYFRYCKDLKWKCLCFFQISCIG